MIILAAVLIAGILFTVSFHHNSKMKGKELYFSGETIITSEIQHFFTKSMTLTEDASNPGDAEQLIHLHCFTMSCDSIPTRRSYQEQSRYNISALPQTTTYLLQGSSINVTLCALSNNSTDRTELLLLNNLTLAKNTISETTPHTGFKFFPTGTDGIARCGTFWYDITTTGYYMLAFLQPLHSILYNYTLNINKVKIDLTSNVSTINYTLAYDEDQCSFSFPFSHHKSCIVAMIEEGGVEPYIHMVLAPHSRQDNTVAGMAASFGVIVVLIAVYMLLAVLCFKYGNKLDTRACA